MRPTAPGRTIAGLIAVAGPAAGTVAAAGTGFTATAATVPTAQTATVAQSVAPAATRNFVLTTADAKNVREFLTDHWDCTGATGGIAGSDTRAAVERFAA